MELLTLRDPALVVALDIGSTYSGYAWQWRDDFLNNRGNVEFNMNWGGGVSQFHKTKTCLLLDANEEIISFGNRADHKFCQELAKDEHGMAGKWFFFKRFKLYLYRKEIPEICEDELSQVLPLKIVMSKFIQALKDHFLKQMETKKQTLDLKKTLWVITVPQIWSDNAKRFMRECGELAGINKRNLLLAHEPEAAAIACVHLPQQQREAMGNLGQVGDKFVTADLGGGTADISAIEILEGGLIKEICPGKGGLVGGQDVNNAFLQACTELFERTIWDEMFSPKNADNLLTLEDDFESKKVSLGTEQDDQYISLNIPRDMERKLENKTLTLKESAKDSQYFKSEKGQLKFDPKYVREILFNATIEKVSKLIGDTLGKAEVITKVILVGGFSESPVVVESIRKAMSKEFPEITVYVPTSPFRAVLYGAVLYGHDPFIFKSRISRETYGVDTYISFDETIHDANKREYIKEKGKSYCKDIFSIHVQKGQSVILQENQPSITYTPLSLGQTAMAFSIYSSSSRDPKYITDAECKKHGEIRVEMPDTTGELSRKVVVTMMYGGTELAVTAQDVTTGKEFETKIRFDVS